MWKYFSTLLLTALVVLAIGFVRSNYSNRMKNPLHKELELTANFGELRPDHFHMGLDIRTGGKENLPVYAIEDGYISRIVIEAGGYGKAVFVTHKNGITSLYAHLNNYSEKLEQYLHQQQYKTKSWHQDLSFDAGRFPVKKGDLVAYSGNTGHSEGPHLHFELRDTKTGNNLNPALYGYTVSDHTPPSILALYWYDRRYSTYEKAPVAVGKDRKIIKVNSPLVSLGIRTEDRVDGSRFRYGIYRAQLWMDDELIHDMTMNNFSQEDSRYVNACIDYSMRITKGQNILHLSRLPGNHLPVPGGKNGIISLPDKSPHKVHIRVTDIAGNATDLQFDIQLASVDPVNHASRGKRIAPGQAGILNGERVVVHFPKRSFYDTVSFILKETPGKNAIAISPRIQLHNPTVPVHERYTVKINSGLRPGNALRDKIVMQFTGFRKKSVVKGRWEGNSMRASFNELGTVQLFIDTMAPQVRPDGWNNNEIFSNEPGITLVATDNMGDIAALKAELDGQWILFEQKGNAFTYRFDKRCSSGKHSLRVQVTDVAGNITNEQFFFTKK